MFRYELKGIHFKNGVISELAVLGINLATKGW